MTLALARVSRLVELARSRQARDLVELPKRGYWFDEDAVENVIWFVTQLKHTKGEWAGQPFNLQEWQAVDILAPLFGWKREDGTRRFRIGYVEIPRKNGKTELLAAIGDYLLLADGENGAEIYSAATKKDQAKLVFDAAKGMIEKSDFSNYIKTYRNNISVPELGSKFEPIGADADTLDGLNPHGIIIDELHAHRSREVWDVLQTAMGSRREPLMVAITTAGVYRPESIGWEMHDYAVKVLEGAIEDETFFAYISAAEPDDDWTDPATWAAANPNLGISLKPDYIQDQCERAKASPGFVNSFLRLHLNIWTASVDRWLDIAKWNEGDQEPIEALDGRECYGGLDLASNQDTTALILAFPSRDGSVDLVCRFWIPEDSIVERSRKDRVPYDAWARDGWLITTPGNVTDYAFIRAEVAELRQQYNIREIGYDRWNASQLVTELIEDGVTMVPIGQGFASLAAPTMEFERLVISGNLNHAGHPVLRWQASNVSTEQDPAGNLKPSKSKSTERIDGIVAGIMAIDRMTRHQNRPSVYETRGLLSI